MTEIKRAIKLGCMILVMMLSVLAVQVPTVSAGVPSVTITTSLAAGHTELNITIVHDAPPALSASHYINKVELTITNASGTSWVNFTATLPAAPQSVTFYVNYDMGILLANTSISVRAQCNVHGWSSAATGSAGPAATPPSTPADNTMLYGGIIAIIVVLVIVVALVMKRKGGKEKPRE